jgi:hypothetical protein
LIRLLLGPLELRDGPWTLRVVWGRFAAKGVRSGADRGYLQALLSELPFGIDNDKQLSDYDTGAAELRSDELLRVAAGLPVPGLDSLKDLRFPESAQSGEA